jgi:hypothetical protein
MISLPHIETSTLRKGALIIGIGAAVGCLSAVAWKYGKKFFQQTHVQPKENIDQEQTEDDSTDKADVKN